MMEVHSRGLFYLPKMFNIINIYKLTYHAYHGPFHKIFINLNGFFGDFSCNVNIATVVLGCISISVQQQIPYKITVYKEGKLII